jgi:hypothetical protein
MAEVSTATTTQMTATATTTPIGTTRFSRMRSHRDGLRSSDIRGKRQRHNAPSLGNILARRKLNARIVAKSLVFTLASAGGGAKG